MDEQNREDEPPEYTHVPVVDDDDVEYEAPEDDYIPPEPPMRKGELKATDDELPFE